MMRATRAQGFYMKIWKDRDIQERGPGEDGCVDRNDAYGAV